MSQKASLITLPVKILHRIFNELDRRRIFFSVHDVFQPLRAPTADKYLLHRLDFTSTSNRDLHRLLPLIRPECVIGQPLSLIDIRLFTRLCSLTLLNIEKKDVHPFVRDARRCPVTSLILHWTFYNCLEAKDEEIVPNLSSIIARPTRLHLGLLSDDDVPCLMTKLQWPVECKLRYLRMKSIRAEHIPKMIAASPDLETLVIDEEPNYYSYLH
jgi:hypothetical protein